MRQTYQTNYSAHRTQMYDKRSREQKAVRMIKTFKFFWGKRRIQDLSLLDVGSSTGIIDNILASKFKRVVGIDIDKSAVEFAKRSFKRRNLEFMVGDAMEIDFPSDAFDVVICAHVYEHVPDSPKLFSEIFRVLKPGGVCYLAAVNRLWPLEPHYNLPFLSWFPKLFANFYIKIARKGSEYYENPRSYWGLKTLTKKFIVHDFTTKIIQSPKKFGYDDTLLDKSFIRALVTPFFFLTQFISPTFFWLLEKEARHE